MFDRTPGRYARQLCQQTPPTSGREGIPSFTSQVSPVPSKEAAAFATVCGGSAMRQCGASSQSSALSMANYIEAMCTRLGVDPDRGRRCDTPLSGPITDLTPLGRAEAKWFMSACGMIGWLAGTGRCDLKLSHSRISSHMASPRLKPSHKRCAMQPTTSTCACSSHLVAQMTGSTTVIPIMQAMLTRMRNASPLWATFPCAAAPRSAGELKPRLSTLTTGLLALQRVALQVQATLLRLAG